MDSMNKTDLSTVGFPRRHALSQGLAALAGAAALAGLTRSAYAQDDHAHDHEHGENPHAAMAALMGFDASGKAILPKLEYAYDALEPHIDAKTMELHHSKHHQAYVDGYNKAIDDLAKAREGKDFAALEQHERKLAFHGSGHVLHNIFWMTMAPKNGSAPEGELADAIKRDFGSHDAMVAHFTSAATSVEGNGWAILAMNVITGKLIIQQALNHQHSTVTGALPLLPLDMWEHAYYLKHQNKRADYVKEWWNVVNWKNVTMLYMAHHAHA